MHKFIFWSCLALCLCCGAVARGATIQLSANSSDSTPASDLNAVFDFSVLGNTLTLVVSNLTDGSDGGVDNGFDINQLYFNGTANVTSLALVSPTSEWHLSTDQKAGGFGRFDFALVGGVGNKPGNIPGESSRTFVLTIAGTGPFADTHFTTTHSIIPPGNTPSLVAAKFIAGPCDDSAYGATVPEPATLLILALGSLTVVRRTRR